jgi:hypothetical protein
MTVGPLEPRSFVRSIFGWQGKDILRILNRLDLDLRDGLSLPTHLGPHWNLDQNPSEKQAMKGYEVDGFMSIRCTITESEFTING